MTNQELRSKPYEKLSADEKLEIKNEAERILSEAKSLSGDNTFVGAVGIKLGSTPTIPDGHIEYKKGEQGAIFPKSDSGEELDDELFKLTPIADMVLTRDLIVNTVKSDTYVMLWIVPFKPKSVVERMPFDGTKLECLKFIEDHPRALYWDKVTTNTAFDRHRVGYMSRNGKPIKTNRFLTWLNTGVYDERTIWKVWISKLSYPMNMFPQFKKIKRMFKSHKGLGEENVKRINRTDDAMSELINEHTPDDPTGAATDYIQHVNI
jgi:hypothetical protein